MRAALTIAGSDSCAGAGVQMDLRVFAAHGVYGCSALTALTAQNSTGVRRVHHVPPRFVAEQIDVLCADLPIAAAKVGMLGRAQAAAVVAERVRRREIPNLVVDPVILAKDGTLLLPGRALEILKRELLPRAVLVTPNVPEAEALSGLPIRTGEDARAAAERIAAFGVRGVVIKGGHLPGDPVDLLLWQGEFHSFGGERIRADAPPVHGTGCIYSAAAAARLALGDSVPDACREARRFTVAAIRTAVPLGKGYPLAVPAAHDAAISTGGEN